MKLNCISALAGVTLMLFLQFFFPGLTVSSVWPPCSWELASVLRDTKERFDSAGVKLIAIGVGTPAKARILAKRVCICLSS